jgi:SAM-dependent methyltransferase
VVAIDASPEMVAAVAARVDEVRTGDLEQLDLDGQYDCVLAIGVLDFVSEPREAMATLARLVGPGGRLVVLVPRTGLGGLYYRLEKRLSGFDTNLYTVRWLRERGRELGLDLVAARAPLPTNLAVRFDRARVPPPSARE